MFSLPEQPLQLGWCAKDKRWEIIARPPGHGEIYAETEEKGAMSLRATV